MVEHNYKLEGRGSTTEEADRVLESESSDLVGKLKTGKASEDLTVVKQRFEGVFTLKSGIDPSTVDARGFSVEDNSGWEAVEAKRSRLKDGGSYDSSFLVERYLALTEEQLVAIRGPKETSAGPTSYDSRPSVLRMPSRL